MAKNHDLISLEINLMHETEKAYLFTNLKGEKTWIPKSMSEYDGNELQLPEWLAQEKELI